MEQINRLYAACDDAKERWVAARDRAILAVLLDTGIRANELCDLTRDRCFLDDGAPYLLINGKGRKQRIVSLGKQSAYRLNLNIVLRRAIPLQYDRACAVRSGVLCSPAFYNSLRRHNMKPISALQATTTLKRVDYNR